ncbi:MAG: helix-turn-helix domain-containing protein [Phycisphaerales bacterium]
MATKREEIMTMDELAAYLKISKSTLYKLATEDKLPGHKIGKRWRFHKDAVDEWVKRGIKPGQGKASSGG